MSSAARTAFTLFGLVLSCAGGCAPGDGGDPASAASSISSPGPAGAAPVWLTRCEPSGASKAVVVPMSGVNEVRVYAQNGGTLVDNGIRIHGLTLPRHVALRVDGAEAVVGWGTVTGAWGVAVLTLAPDGSAAALAQTVTLGTGHEPWAIAYAGPDRIVVSAAGPTHEIVTLERRAGATSFAEKARAPSPGAFGFSLLGARGSDSLVLSHIELGSEEATTVQVIGADTTGAFVPRGALALVGPPTIDLVMHPSGHAVYAQTSDPAQPISLSDITGGGYLQVLGVDGSGVHPMASTKTARTGSSIAMDPAGRFLVTQGNVYEIDQATKTPTVRKYTLATAVLGPAGEVVELPPESAATAGLLFWDMVVAPSGHLVVQRVMFPGSVPENEENHLEIFAQPRPGAWELCEQAFLPGSAKIAIAP